MLALTTLTWYTNPNWFPSSPCRNWVLQLREPYRRIDTLYPEVTVFSMDWMSSENTLSYNKQISVNRVNNFKWTSQWPPSQAWAIQTKHLVKSYSMQRLPSVKTALQSDPCIQKHCLLNFKENQHFSLREQAWPTLSQLTILPIWSLKKTLLTNTETQEAARAGPCVDFMGKFMICV